MNIHANIYTTPEKSVDADADVVKDATNIGEQKKRILCKVCSKPTSSAPGTCKIHAGGFYVLQFYSRQLSKNTASSPAFSQ